MPAAGFATDNGNASAKEQICKVLEQYEWPDRFEKYFRDEDRHGNTIRNRYFRFSKTCSPGYERFNFEWESSSKKSETLRSNGCAPLTVSYSIKYVSTIELERNSGKYRSYSSRERHSYRCDSFNGRWEYLGSDNNPWPDPSDNLVNLNFQFNSEEHSGKITLDSEHEDRKYRIQLLLEEGMASKETINL